MEFLKIDDSYLKKHKILDLESRPINKGTVGAVYKVHGNSRIVVKKDYDDSFSLESVEDEMKTYNKLHLSDVPLFSPSKLVETENHEEGIARPFVTPIFDPNVTKREYFNKKFVEKLRNTVIGVSYKKIVFGDGFQLGYDKNGRLIQYDIGKVYKAGSINEAFRENNRWWKDMGKYLRKDIGEIKRSQATDKKYLGNAQRHG